MPFSTISLNAHLDVQRYKMRWTRQQNRDQTHQHPPHSYSTFASFFPSFLVSLFPCFLSGPHSLTLVHSNTSVSSAGRSLFILCNIKALRPTSTIFDLSQQSFQQHHTYSVIMPVPSYGAMPLSKMFLAVRVLQAICMIIVIGITSNFVQMIVTTGVEPPKEFVGTLSVVSSPSILRIGMLLTFLRPASPRSTLWSPLATTGRTPTSASSS